MTSSHYFATHSSTVIQRLYDQKTKLYPHQQQALLKLLEMGASGELLPDKRSPDSGAAFFLIGVGCGKTVVLQSAPYILGRYIQGKQVIFLSHNCTLRQRVMDDFPSKKLSKGVAAILEEWELYKRGILDSTTRPPTILELSTETYSHDNFYLDKADILVANWQFLGNLVSRGDIDPNNVGLIVVDEAHHSAAKSYRAIFNYFNKASLLFLTGTRHRGDGEQLPYVRYLTEQHEEENGCIVLKKSPRTDFEFTIQDAWKLQPPIIKRITFSPAKSDGFKVEEEGVEVEYTAEQFYEKAEKEREWFRQCILADSFCKPVLDRAVEILEAKRKAGGHPHRMIIRALNIKHAHRLRSLCENYPLLNNRIGLVHSDNEEYDSEGRPSEIFKKFAADEYIALIHVSMVGEGFNVPFASVSVPLCVMRSTQKAEQEFGRIIRKVDGTHPAPYDSGDLQADNMAVVVTHEALGISELFEQFLNGNEYVTVDGEEDVDAEQNRNRFTTGFYHAGDAVLHINNTDGLSNGDEIIIQTYDYEGKEQKIIFSVEDVIDKETIAVFPLLVDLPEGSPARKATNKEESASEFIGHIKLSWHLRIDGKDVPIEEYRRQKALEQRDLIQNQEGEIVTAEGERISDLPLKFRQIILDALKEDESKVELPFDNLEIFCLPGQQKKALQEYHLKRIKKAVIDLSLLALDGKTGRNLLVQTPNSLMHYANKPASNNEQFLHGAILSHVKHETGKEWKKHQTEEEFESAVQIALRKIEEVRQELRLRRRASGI
jgi:superfamily II DNA or RNA helicase